MSRILSVYIEKNGKQEYVGKIVGDSSCNLTEYLTKRTF